MAMWTMNTLECNEKTISLHPDGLKFEFDITLFDNKTMWTETNTEIFSNNINLQK